MKRVKLGEVGVDSGQLMVCDPCYIDSMWERQEFTDVRCFRDTETGAVFGYRVDFEHFESPLRDYGGLTPNALIAAGQWKRVPYTPEGGWGYDTVSHGTMESENGGFAVEYPKGHDGLAVAFRSGFGDGCYEVWAEVLSNEETGGMGERISKVEIILIEELGS